MAQGLGGMLFGDWEGTSQLAFKGMSSSPPGDRGVHISPAGLLPAPALRGEGPSRAEPLIHGTTASPSTLPPTLNLFSIILSSPPPPLHLSCLMNEGWGFKPFSPPRPAALALLLSLG